MTGRLHCDKVRLQRQTPSSLKAGDQDWGDSSVGKVLVTQVQRSKFKSQHRLFFLKLDMMMQVAGQLA